MTASKDVMTAVLVVGMVFFYRLNVLAIAMTRYFESRTNQGER